MAVASYSQPAPVHKPWTGVQRRPTVRQVDRGLYLGPGCSPLCLEQLGQVHADSEWSLRAERMKNDSACSPVSPHSYDSGLGTGTSPEPLLKTGSGLKGTASSTPAAAKRALMDSG